MGIDTVPGLRFGLLGTVGVWRGGEPLRLGGERQRALLALLLVHVNELVSVEQLVEQLFDAQGAQRAGNAVHVAVSRLRRLLIDGEDGQVLQTGPGGYRLSVAPEQLDVAVFERLLEDGRGLLAAGDAVSAAARLREGLGLWRGAPLADLVGVECLQPEIRRLQELRLLAVMERIDADLALSGGRELIAELGALIAANPLQERLRGQLMLALYRAGRQTEALQVYRELSELLRDELGLEPSRALADLERSILQHDTTLNPSVPSASTRAGRLPLDATPFLGRARELAELTALIQRAENRLVTLTGAGGSGKTRLALQIAQAAWPDYRDGAWFVACADITDPDLITPTISQTLGLAEQPGMTPTHQLKQWLGDRQLLLLVDNLEQLTAGTPVLGELLAECPHLKILVTSREPLHLAAEQQYDVAGLKLDDAIELFTARAHAVAPHLHVDAELAAQISERLDRLPLAIELAAARTKTIPPAEILTRLQTHLPVLATGPRDAPRRQHTLQATIDWSYDQLTDHEQHQFAQLAIFAGGFTLHAAHTVCNTDLDTLQTLTDRSLITTENDRYTMLQTLHEYALDKLNQTDQASELHHRHAHWLVDLMETPGTDWFEPRDPGRINRIRAEQENFRSALEWAAQSGERETLARLAVFVFLWLWYQQSQLSQAEQWLGLAREHLAEYPLLLQALILSSVSMLARQRGRYKAGADHGEQALAIYRQLGDHRGICYELNARSIVAAEHRDLAAARAALEESILHARRHDVPDVLPVALSNLGDVAIDEGNLTEARALLEESLTVAESLTPPTATSVILINLTHIANLQGRPADAATLGRKALTAALEHGESRNAAGFLMEIAWPVAQQGQLDRAAQLLGAAIAFLDSAGVSLERTERVCEQRTRAILCEQLNAAELQALLDAGRKLSLEDALREALSDGLPAAPDTHIAPPR